jgi:hypothetical protein
MKAFLLFIFGLTIVIIIAFTSSFSHKSVFNGSKVNSFSRKESADIFVTDLKRNSKFSLCMINSTHDDTIIFRGFISDLTGINVIPLNLFIPKSGLMKLNALTKTGDDEIIILNDDENKTESRVKMKYKSTSLLTGYDSQFSGKFYDDKGNVFDFMAGTDPTEVEETVVVLAAVGAISCISTYTFEKLSNYYKTDFNDAMIASEDEKSSFEPYNNFYFGFLWNPSFKLGCRVKSHLD